jgi:hypothetical protein
MHPNLIYHKIASCSQMWHSDRIYICLRKSPNGKNLSQKKNTGLRWILQYFLEAGSKVFVFVSVINQERKVLGASNTQS